MNHRLSDQIAAALVMAAEAKNDAVTKRRKADRIFDALLLQQTGGSADERKARARQHSEYIRADDIALDAEHRANIAKAQVDGLECRFEEWRTSQATARAEMQLR